MIGLLVLGAAGAAQAEDLIRYQGQAVDAQGVPLEGPYELTFRLYPVETGGAPAWEERQPDVVLGRGHFSVLLGSKTPFGSIDWRQPCWLGIQVGSEPELTPRQRITSVPMAIVAQQLAEPVTTSTIEDDDSRLVPSGAVILWTGASCPTGYTRVSALDNAMVKLGATYAAPAAGGATELPAHSHAQASHNHTQDAHAHDVWIDQSLEQGWEDISIQASGGGSWQANGIRSATATNQAATAANQNTGSGTYAVLLACRKD